MNKLRKKFGVKVGESMDTNFYNTNRLCLQCYVSSMLRTLACTKWQRTSPKDTRAREPNNWSISFLCCNCGFLQWGKVFFCVFVIITCWVKGKNKAKQTYNMLPHDCYADNVDWINKKWIRKSKHTLCLHVPKSILEKVKIKWRV